jgi:DNA replicative helicase MCM subunit Mcm2 (Cdc46/Mcm family)
VVEFTKADDIQRASSLIDGAIFRINKWAETQVFEGYTGISSIEVPAYQRKQENELLEMIALEKAEYESSASVTENCTETSTNMVEEQQVSDSLEIMDESFAPIAQNKSSLPALGQLFS